MVRMAGCHHDTPYMQPVYQDGRDVTPEYAALCEYLVRYTGGCCWQGPYNIMLTVNPSELDGLKEWAGKHGATLRRDPTANHYLITFHDAV